MLNALKNRWTAVFVAVLLFVVAAGHVASGQDRATTDRARELLQRKEYEQVIALLDSTFGANYSSAYQFYEAHRALDKRLDFIARSRAEADAGNPFVSFFVATALRESFGAEPRAIERYLLNAARAGNAIAAKDLGNIYFSGLQSDSLFRHPSVPSDWDKAKQMFQLCRTDSIVGRDCTIGLGHTLLALQPSQAAEAIALFEGARAFGTLWGMHYFGVGVPADRAKATGYLDRIKSGQLVENDGCAEDVREHADGMAKEEPNALERIAFKFTMWSGRAECLPGGPMHHLDLLERAAKLGSPVATQRLGDYYYFGNHLTRKDPVLAFYHHSVLNMIGNANQRRDANDRLNTLERRMSPADLSEARSLFRRWQESR